MNRQLCLLAALLVAGLAHDASASSDTFQADTAPTVRLAPLSSFSEVVNRPLFTQNRKRQNQPAPSTNALTAPVLSAIVVLKDRRYAVLRDTAHPGGRRITEGDSVGSLTVRRIHRDRVIAIASDGSETVIRLFSDPAGEPAKAAQRMPGGPAPAAFAAAAASEPPPMALAPSGNRPLKPLITSTP